MLSLQGGISGGRFDLPRPVRRGGIGRLGGVGDRNPLGREPLHQGDQHPIPETLARIPALLTEIVEGEGGKVARAGFESFGASNDRRTCWRTVWFWISLSRRFRFEMIRNSPVKARMSPPY
jgi:hypothetical protein